MENWLIKYKPDKIADVICDKSIIQKLENFIKQFTKKNVKDNELTNPNLIIIGQNGIGKTLITDLIIKEYNLEKVITNLSSISVARKNKRKTLNETTGTNRTVGTYYFSLMNGKKLSSSGEYSAKKYALVFDNTSNVSNPKEREAIKAIIKINNKFKYFPIIVIANTKHSKTVNELKKMVTYNQHIGPETDSKSNKKIINQIVMKQPEAYDLIIFIKKICAKENLNIVKSKKDKKDIFHEIVSHSQFDIRRLIKILEELKLIYQEEEITLEKFIKYSYASKKKDIDPGIYEATRLLLNNYSTMENALSLYSEERATIPLMVHENYPLNIRQQYPCLPVDKQIDMMYNISKSISESDKVDGLIYSNQCWNLQPVHGFYSCVMPSYYINHIPEKLCHVERYEYTKDYNKTSIKKINNKVIKKAREHPFFKKVSIYDFLYIALILKTLLEKKEFEKLAQLMKPYGLTLKEIESIIKIDKIKKSKITLTGKQKNTLNELLEADN